MLRVTAGHDIEYPLCSAGSAVAYYLQDGKEPLGVWAGTAAGAARRAREHPVSGKCANGEGSIFPYKNGWAAYVWVTTPEGLKARKWLYGKTREEIYDPWVQLKAKAAKMPIPTSNPHRDGIPRVLAGGSHQAEPGG